MVILGWPKEWSTQRRKIGLIWMNECQPTAVVLVIVLVVVLSSNFTSRSDGRIARHYKWSIEAAFHRFNSPGGIKGWIFLRGKTEIGKILACLQCKCCLFWPDLKRSFAASFHIKSWELDSHLRAKSFSSEVWLSWKMTWSSRLTFWITFRRVLRREIKTW